MLVQTVSVAWAMTSITGGAADKVALVQSATMLPILLLSPISGSIADIYDRRRVALMALCIAGIGICALIALQALNATTPFLLLACCFSIGTGNALFSPTWQLIAREEVALHEIPEAIALTSVGYNVARTGGPAIGGMVVAAWGLSAAYFVAVAALLPAVLTFALRKAESARPTRKPERLFEAVKAGVRLVVSDRFIRTSLIQVFIVSTLVSVLQVLGPLVSKDLLASEVGIYGVLMAAFGIGAVAGALAVGNLRKAFPDAVALTILTVVVGIGCGLVASARSTLIVLLGYLLAGAAYTASAAVVNIGIQVTTERRLNARVLSLYQGVVAGSLAFGGWLWGTVAAHLGTQAAVAIAAMAAALAPVIWQRSR